MLSAMSAAAVIAAGVPDTDYRNDDVDYGHHDTNDTHIAIPQKKNACL